MVQYNSMGDGMQWEAERRCVAGVRGNFFAAFYCTVLGSGFVAMRATLTSEVQQVLEADNLALYLARWSLRGTDPGGDPVVLRGESTEILRRQADGRWLIVIDDPRGTQLLAPG